MDCEACNNLLLDFLYEDLDEVRAAAVRRHKDGCATCASSFERLAGGRRLARSLEPVEAPAPAASLLEAIQKAAAEAREREASRAGTSESPASVAPVIPIEQAPRRVPAWLYRVGEVAMRRQVAMAAVFLLMIGFGLRYYQYQSPTRPTENSDEPAGDVIPATELRTPAPPPRGNESASARRPALPARPVLANAERGVDHRAPQTAHVPAVPTQAQQPAGETEAQYADNSVAPPQTTAPVEQPATPALAAESQNAPTTVARAEPPVAYRNLPAPPQEPMRQVAAQNNSATDPALLRGLPQAPSASPYANNDLRPATNNVWTNTATAASWQSHRQSGDAHRAQGQHDLAAAEYRQALAQNPPPAERAAIANALYATLMSSNRVQEANEVQASYLNRPSDANEAANEVTAAQGAAPSNNIAPRAGSNSNYRAPTSVPQPSRAMPRMRRSSPSPALDYSSQNAL
jgi:tetratricopeptide (TPR) repeat protein